MSSLVVYPVLIFLGRMLVINGVLYLLTSALRCVEISFSLTMMNVTFDLEIRWVGMVLKAFDDVEVLVSDLCGRH